MAGPGLIALILLSANVQLPALIGQRVITRARHVFAREAQVTLAVPSAPRAAWELTIELDGKTFRLEPKVSSRSDSVLYRFKVPAEAFGEGALIVRANGKEARRWSIAIASLADDAPEVAAATADRKAKSYDAAIRKLEAALKSPSASVRAWAEIERGNVAFVLGDRVTADAWWLRGSKSAEAAGLVSEAHARLLGIAYLRHQRGALGPSEQALREAEKYLGLIEAPHLDVAHEYHSGVLHREMGEHMAAIRVLRSALRGAKRIGDDRAQVDTTHALALSLGHLGGFREALRLFEDLSELGELEPLLASYDRTNQGYAKLEAMEAGALPRNYLEVRRNYLDALPFIEEQGIPQRVARAHLRLAQLSLLEGDVSAAEESLKALDGKSAELLANIRWEEPMLRAELAIEKRRFDEAEKLAREVEQGATKEAFGELTEEACTAMILLADNSRARGKHDEAIDRYRAAIEAIDRLATRLEVPRAKAHFMFKGTRAVESLAELLLEKKRAAEALAVLAQAQSGALEDLLAAVRVDTYGEHWRKYRNARADLSSEREKGCSAVRPSERRPCEARLRELELKSEEELQNFYSASGGVNAKTLSSAELIARLTHALARDESLVAIFRLHERWIAFHLTKRDLVYEVASAPPRSWIARAKNSGHVYVLLGDRTESIEPHLYEGPGDTPLAASVSISYLPSSSSLLADRARPNAPAMVIADPDGTLPAARVAGRAIAAQLGGAAYLVGEQATRPEVTGSLSGRSVFHFIGHASLLDGDPWTTELKLAGGESLGIADLLSMRAELGVAVLEGCTTGAQAATGGLGFPHVMISTGAHSVLATVRDLGAGEATKFLERFYAAGGSTRPAQAFRDAIRASLLANDSAWRAFRLWGRR